jgi:hypothetical protein
MKPGIPQKVRSELMLFGISNARHRGARIMDERPGEAL